MKLFVVGRYTAMFKCNCLHRLLRHKPMKFRKTLNRSMLFWMEVYLRASICWKLIHEKAIVLVRSIHFYTSELVKLPNFGRRGQIFHQDYGILAENLFINFFAECFIYRKNFVASQASKHLYNFFRGTEKEDFSDVARLLVNEAFEECDLKQVCRVSPKMIYTHAKLGMF